MKLFYKVVLLFILATFNTVYSSAQVKKVQYQLRYNPIDTAYDVYLIIHEGKATSSNDRAQFNAQISLLVPTETKLQVHKLYMPLRNNINYDGTSPMKWILTNTVVSPISKPKYDFISFTPVLSNNDAHRYNNLAQGDSIKLFSVRPNPLPSCLTDIRLFENGLDPNSAAPGMQGGNFNNGFTIGSIEQKYLNNLAPKNMPGLINIDLPQDTLLVGESISLPSAALNTFWVSNYPLVATLTNATNAIGIAHGIATFTLVDKENNKCGTSLPQFFTGGTSYNAGSDLTTCANTKVTLYGTNPTTGLWSELPSNPGPSYAENLGNGIATILFGNTSGVYRYKYGSSLEGYDTMQVIVNPAPIVGLEQSFVCIEGNEVHVLTNNEGTWVSNNPTIAVVNNDSSIKPFSIGKVNFSFTDKNTACTNNTIDLYVYETPQTSIAEDTIKMFTTTSLTPNSGGTWQSTNPSVATVTNGGLITALGTGQSKFVFTQANNNLCPSQPITLTVVSGQLDVKGPSLICIGTSAQLYPKPSDAKWLSENEAVITVDENGKITAVGPGTTNVFLTSKQGEGSIKIVVNELPKIDFFSLESVCVGSQFSIQNIGQINFTWQSSNENVATINSTLNNVYINPLKSGKVKFIATNAFGCKSTTDELTVNPKPSLTSISNALCLDESMDLTKINGSLQGTWNNYSPEIIDIQSNVLKGIKEGNAKLTFNDVSTGCVSDVLSFDVKSNPWVSYINTDSVEIGQSIELKPSGKGTWSGYDNTIADINDESIVRGISTGSTLFHFTDLFGCKAKPMAVKVFPKQILNGVANLEKLKLNFYPNPFNDKLNITCNASIIEVKVFNLYSKLVRSTTEQVLNTTDLIPGIYLLEVLTSRGKSLVKVIKE